MAAAAADATADSTDHERASMGTMTGWQALADEVITCKAHAAYSVRCTLTRGGVCTFGALLDCGSVFNAQGSHTMLNWVDVVHCSCCLVVIASSCMTEHAVRVPRRDYEDACEKACAMHMSTAQERSMLVVTGHRRGRGGGSGGWGGGGGGVSWGGPGGHSRAARHG